MVAAPLRRPPAPGAQALRLMAAVAVPLTLASRVGVSNGVTFGTLVVAGLTPAWLPRLVRGRHGSVLLLTVVAFLGGGFATAWVAGSDHAVQWHSAIATALRFGTYLGGVGALVWAADLIGLPWVVALYGTGWLGMVIVHHSTWAGNPWKYAFSIPVTLIVLSLAERRPRIVVRMLMLAVLAAVTILSDYRSAFAMFVISGGILLWQWRQHTTVAELSLGRFIAAMVAVLGVAYYTLTRLLVSGLFGEALKTRSETQVESSGTLLLGGRPEWTVTVRLARERPWGFGFGTLPSPHDLQLGRDGFASIQLSSQDHYLEHYVLNAAFRLHSITADLWSAGGIVGVALALVIIWILVTGLAHGLAQRAATSLSVFLTLLALWDIGFSPVYSNLPDVMLALAVALVAIETVPDPARGPDLGTRPEAGAGPDAGPPPSVAGTGRSVAGTGPATAAVLLSPGAPPRIDGSATPRRVRQVRPPKEFDRWN